MIPICNNKNLKPCIYAGFFVSTRLQKTLAPLLALHSLKSYRTMYSMNFKSATKRT